MCGCGRNGLPVLSLRLGGGCCCLRCRRPALAWDLLQAAAARSARSAGPGFADSAFDSASALRRSNWMAVFQVRYCLLLCSIGGSRVEDIACALLRFVVGLRRASSSPHAPYVIRPHRLLRLWCLLACGLLVFWPGRPALPAPPPAPCCARDHLRRRQRSELTLFFRLLIAVSPGRELKLSRRSGCAAVL